MLIQFHLLQNYQPSNLNRDDTGSPKDALFGGGLRGRISSQCLKRSIRRSEIFKDEFGKDGLLGERTKLLPQIVRDELKALEADDEAIAAIVERVPEIGRESTKKKKEIEDEASEETEETTESEVEIEGTAQLIFIDRKTEARPLAEKLLEMYKKVGVKKWKDAKISDITKELGDRLPRSVDIAMFGRMTTSQAFRNVQASVQVAHALSTNTLKQEFDYFTAVDDISGETGAGMIGDVEFNSCTYYKYINVHWEELVSNLGGDKDVAQRSVLALLEAAAMAHPSGKQNGFGAFNLPDFVLVEVSDRNLPISYANAFLKPVGGFGEKSLMANSVKQMSEYVTKLSKAYNLQPKRAYLAVDDLPFLDLGSSESLDDLKGWLSPQLN
ncbi:MAG TPA: type I-E CRISPR-associated protein Cas7/Cse4/CasC [Anaerolineales bacterium]|nr:type I-E CRISPR-associated protein Cas7/Cse4/CasC [Anaerolineales bacterium]